MFQLATRKFRLKFKWLRGIWTRGSERQWSRRTSIKLIILRVRSWAIGDLTRNRWIRGRSLRIRKLRRIRKIIRRVVIITIRSRRKRITKRRWRRKLFWTWWWIESKQRNPEWWWYITTNLKFPFKTIIIKNVNSKRRWTKL